jgi:hypothetical protein
MYGDGDRDADVAAVARREQGRCGGNHVGPV